LKLVLMSALFGVLFLISGCATQCESVAAAYNSCELSERSVQVDTENFCGLVDAFNARAASGGAADCTQKWTAHLTCWQTNLAEICDNGFDGCDQSANDWQDCMIAYCDGLTADQYDPQCQGTESLFGEDFFGPLSVPSPFQSGF
jgi:hypothetical protein